MQTAVCIGCTLCAWDGTYHNFNVSPPAAKALYRQGLAKVVLKEDEEAEKVILEALSLAKDDKAIAAELESIRQRKKTQRDKEKAAYKRMFE